MREFQLIDHIISQSRGLQDHVVIPPGDDMGAIKIANTTLLITVDQIADGTHVNISNTPIQDIAHKAIARSLSDVAAMAAKPLACVATAAMPDTFDQSTANQLFDAMRVTAEKYHCPLIGGDVTIWNHPLLITVTILAEPDGITPILRSGAKPNDAVYVTGSLGGAWNKDGSGLHLTAEPRIELARTLAHSLTTNLHSMIDLSDGLASDLRHICDMSNVNATIDIDQLPISNEAHDLAAIDNHPPYIHALCDGEDYELCFTVSPKAVGGLTGKDTEQTNNIPITRIGTIHPLTKKTPIPTIHLKHHDGTIEPFQHTGWEHHN